MTGRTDPPAALRVVVADDQASVREGLVLLLGLLPDIEVVGAAANGEEALELVADKHPDAILLDLHMPFLDGLQGRLGGDEQSLRDGLAEIRMAFVQIHNAERAREAGQGA